MRCGDMYRGGCDRVVGAPSWYHREEWLPDPDGRPNLPTLREDLPEELVRTLAGSSERDVRHVVLTHPATPPDVIAHLAGDPDAGVRGHAVGRTCSIPLLRGALQDEWTVRRAAAGNPHSTVELLELLSRDPEAEVRGAVVRNRAAPDRLVDGGVRDPHDHVRWWALQRTGDPALIRAATKGRDRRDRQWVALNPNCPAELLTRLAKDSNPYVRANVARNPGSPEALLRRLAGDCDHSVANMARIRTERPGQRSTRA